MSIDSFLHLRWLVWRNCEKLHTQIPKLRFDLSQLDQLLITVWSPPSTIKNNHRCPLLNCIVEIELLSLRGSQSHPPEWCFQRGEGRLLLATVALRPRNWSSMCS